jgi:hypothetical protein
MSTHLRVRILVLLGLSLATLASTGCSDDGATGDEPPDAADATALVGDATTSTSEPLPVGEPVTRFSLAVGDCINDYPAIDVLTRVGCDTPHDREVFHAESHPAPFGERWPGDLQMQEFALSRCYEQFAAFAGTLYEVSRLEIGAITPTQQNFEDARARYRTITCFVHDSDGAELVGSMRGRGE